MELSSRIVPCAVLLLAGLATACKSGPSGNGSKRQEGPQEEQASDEGAGTDGTSRIETKEIEYSSGDTTLRGFLAWDAAKTGKRPGILVVHEWWGHNDYVRDRAKMLAELGYTAFALDMYGEGKNTEHPADAKKFSAEVMSNMDVAVKRFEAARKVLEAHETTDPEKTAAIGYCFGGAVVLHMARTGIPLDGVASFHGNLGTGTPAQPGAIKAKLLVAHGAADPFVPPEQVEAFKEEMKKAGADMEFIAYPGAKHAFTNPAATELGKQNNLPIAYDESADKKSWEALKAFLQRIFAE